MADMIYEDEAVLVVRKPAGTESQRGRSFAMDMESGLKNYLAKRNPEAEPYLGVVHRLDRPVAGVMVYAKTREAAASLSRQFAGKTACKIYEALLPAALQPEEGRLQDWVETDPKNNMTMVAEYSTESSRQSRVKKAVLDYRMIPVKDSAAFTVEGSPAGLLIRTGGRLTGIWANGDAECLHAVRIRLLTGRHHQIRVQLAHAGAPVLGDTRYGHPSPGLQMKGAIGLCAVQLSFRHPVTGKYMTFGIDGRIQTGTSSAGKQFSDKL